MPPDVGDIFLELDGSEPALLPEDEYLESEEVGVSTGVSTEDWRRYLLTVLEPWFREAERDTEFSRAKVESLSTALEEVLREE